MTPTLVGIMLQITAPLRNFLKGSYSKVYNINIIYFSPYAQRCHLSVSAFVHKSVLTLPHALD